MKKRIEVNFHPNGEVTVETKGFAGKSCLDATSTLEEALGKMIKTSNTSEFYKKEVDRNQQIEQG